MSTTKTAILMTGTYREVDFLLDIMTEITQGIDHDLYIVLRHTSGDVSRLGDKEADFQLPTLGKDNVFLCELPSIDKDEVMSRYLIPVGPTDNDRECAILGMFHGVFTAITMMRASLRHYDYVLKTRTDYLPPLSLPEMIKTHEDTGKIIVDGCANWYNRYSDRLDILWHGSLNDILCFAPYDDFLKVWDFEDILVKCWTGIPETTLFRSAMWKFVGDDIQSPRRNETFLKKYFIWDLNDTKQSFHVLRKRASLPKQGEATYFKGNEVVKYFADENKVKLKVERAELLKGLGPEITRVSKNFFCYEYVGGKILTECDVDTFSYFLDWMNGSVWHPLYLCDDASKSGFRQACWDFYARKTRNRLKLLDEQTGLTISLADVDWDWLCDGMPCLFHGDPQVENIIVTEDGFCLLDWREDFGGLSYGDVYYDLAKVYHSLIVAGQVIRRGGFSVDDKGNFTLESVPKLMGFKGVMDKWIVANGYDLKKVKVLTALIYLNIAPLYQEPYSKFLYYFGKEALRESLCH